MAAAKKKPDMKLVNTELEQRGEFQLIRFENLFLSDRNVRKKEPDHNGIVQLASLIKSQNGIVQNMVVYPETVDGVATGRFGVTGGGRRYRAIELLVKQGDFDKSHLLPSMVYAEADATELSIIENSGRETMHPADEFEAFKKLVDEGKSAAHIAAMYGCAENLVLRRLKLANIAPRFIDLFRAGKIEMMQLEALASSSDHEQQIQVWDSLPEHNRHFSTIKQLLTQDKYHLHKSNLGRVVAEIYRQRGGAIEADLFGQETDEYAVDADLVLQIANEILDKAKAEFETKGAWVETHIELDYATLHGYEYASTYERELTPEEQAEIDTLQARSEELEAQMEQDELEISNADDIADEKEAERVKAEANERYNIADAELDKVTDRISEIETASRLVSDFHAPYSGTLIGFMNGQLSVFEFRIRPDDKKAAAAARKATQGGINSDVDSNDSSDSKEAPYTERLTRQLSAQRTYAMRMEVSRNVLTAKRMLAARLAVGTLGFYCWDSSMHVSITHIDCTDVIDALQEDKAYQAFDQEGEKWKAKLGEMTDRNFASMFEAVKKLTEAELDEFLAYLTAASIDTLCSQNAKPENALYTLVAKETGMQISDWFAPTATNFYGLLKKDVLFDIITPHTTAENIVRLGKMKKGDLANEAQAIMDGKGYMPALMQP